MHRFVVAQLCTWGAQGGKLELEHMSRFLHIEGGVSAFGGIISIRMQTQQKCDKACAKHLSTMQQHTEIKVSRAKDQKLKYQKFLELVIVGILGLFSSQKSVTSVAGVSNV